VRRPIKLVLCATLFAATSCAYAQSSVTLYGSVDNLFDVSNQGEGTVTKLTSGGTYGSRWGLTGTEDLGDGYKAIFKLEDGFSSTTGVIGQGGALFGRTAWMGLQGPQGTLTFGRQYSPECLAVFGLDAFNDGLAGSFFDIDQTLKNGVVQTTLMTDVMTCRINNSVVYATPSIDGLTTSLMYGLGGVPGSLSQGSTASIAVNYLAGPLELRGGYIRLKDPTDPGSYVEWGMGGTYVIGPAKLYAGYTKDIYSDTNTPTAEGSAIRYAMLNIGMKYQVTSFLTLILQVTRVIDTSTGLPASQNAYDESAELSYQLSRRTNLYGAYSQINNKNGSTYSLGGSVYYGSAALPDAMARSVQVGIRTVF
jgi:predicted porin